MRHPWKLPLAVVCLLALASLPLLPARRGAAQAVTYTATDLGTLGGAQSTALGLDECGKVVGESNPTGSGFFHPYFWDGATMTDLGTFGGQNGGASAVNSGGRVAGFAQTATSEQRPFAWTQAAGKSDLGMAGSGAAAYDLNDSNQVVGQWETSPLQDRAFVWTQATGMQIVTAPWGTPIAAYGINNAGHIVGTAQTSGGASHAFLSSGGVVTDLGTLGGTNSFAYDLNETGVVVGHANIPSSNASRPFHAFRWTSAGGMQDLGTLGGARSIAYGVNASGQIVGYAEVSPGVNHAFLWADANANGAHDAGEMKDLNTLAPTAGWTYEEARAVNDRGQIVVTAANGSGQRRAFLLTPDNAGPSPCDPPGALQFSAAAYAVGEAGTNATVTVTRADGSAGAVSVSYATSNGTATAGSDYTAASGTLNFANGETSKTFNVAVLEDALDEADETVNLTLSAATGGATLGTQTTAVLTITDNDAPPALSVGDVTVTEGNAGTVNAVFNVTLSAASAQTVTVNYATADNSATQPGDYASISGTLTFSPGDTSETVTVAVAGDATDEPNETFFVNLSSPSNASVADAQGVGTITDDDGAPSLSIGDPTPVAEGNSGTTAVTFNVSLLPASGQTVTVNYATADGTATSASGDYAAASGTLTFDPGQTSKTVTVNVNGDAVGEAHETFFLNLSSPSNATISDNQAQATVNNDDAALSINDPTPVVEGNSGTSAVTFTVTLSHASINPVSVAYTTSNGTATAGNDYTAASGTLNFAAGHTSETVTVAVNGETTFETNETFNVTLSSPSVGATISDNTGVGTITNDDTVPAFSIGDLTPNEGNSATTAFTFTVTLSAPSGVAASVNYATTSAGGTATEGNDYAAANGTLNFAAGDTSETFIVNVKGDNLFESNETFFVNLTLPSGATIADAQALGTILNDEPESTFRFGPDPASYNVNEGQGTATITVTRSGSTAGGVSVNYATSVSSATAGFDYTAASGTLTFAEGDVSESFTVPILTDTLFEGTESVQLTLSSPVGGTIATPNPTFLSITDNTARPTLQFSATNSTTVAEGGTATVTVVRSGGTNGGVTVNYAASNGTATAGSDYEPTTGTLTFAEGDTSESFTVPITNDALDEANETVNLTLSNPGGNGQLGTNNTATLTITDNDAPPTLSISDVVVTEGNAGTVNADFNVTLSGASGQTVTVNFATADGTAKGTPSGSDYGSMSGTLTFDPGQTSTRVRVSVLGDGTSEATETFSVNLSGATNATIGDGTGVGTINDDDATPSLSIGDATVGESGNFASFNVALSNASGQPVTVGYATSNGTAVAPGDYKAANSGTVTFNPGETLKTVTVNVSNDTLDEADETFNVTLTNPSNATIGHGTAVGTITDDDATPTLSVDNVTVIEGNAGATNLIFAVTLSAPSGRVVTVNYATADNSATQPGDYAPVSGTLTIAPGRMFEYVEAVAVVADTVDEPNETFFVNLSSPSNATVADGQAEGIITDDDGVPSLSVADLAFAEHSTGAFGAPFVVTLAPASGQTVTVNYSTADGTATVNSDYGASGGTLTFAPGETTKTISVSVSGDMTNEADETFFVNLSGATNATITDAQGVGTIQNDDAPLLDFLETSFPAAESSHFVRITVFRSGDPASPVNVDFATADGTAAERTDYTAASGTLRFAANETSKTFDVLLTEDAFREGNETINLTLSNPTGGAALGAQAAATVVIAADDNPPPAGNPIDNSSDFVRQHYHDFLNREPDADGLAFWVGGIESCGADLQCREVKRINTSAAFFLSIEFQETGYLVYRAFKAAYGDATSPGVAVTVPVVRLNEFLPDTRRIGEGFVVGPAGWEARLEANKNAYVLEFVARQRFTNAYPSTLTPAEFVDALYANAGVQPSADERQAAVAEFGAAATSADAAARGRALRRVAEHPSLVQAELRRAFVLMQYFGYLRRNPDDAPEPGLNFGGWNFWLGKLNEFNGDFVQAEMVKAFLDSAEYRNRFGQ